MLKGLWRFVRPYWGWWVGSIISSVAAVNCGLLIPKHVGLIIDDLRAGTPPGAMVGRFAVIIVLASAASGLLLTSMRWMAPIAAQRIAHDVRNALLARMTLLDAPFFQKKRTGDLITRVASDASAIEGLVGFGVIGFVNLFLNVVLAFVYMLQVSAKLALLVLGTFPFFLGLLFLMLRAAARRFEGVQGKLSELSSKIQENAAGMRLVKATASEAREEERFNAIQAEYKRQVLRHARVQQPLRATAVLLLNLLFVASVLLVARPLLASDVTGSNSGVTLGGFVAFLTYLFLLFPPLLGLGIVLDEVQRGIVSWGRVKEILSAEPSIKSGELKPAQVKGELTFEKVSLVVDGRKLLDEVSFTVPAGKTLGITGRTGAGKSLLGALLLRLIEPTSGRILIDGTDIKLWTLEALRGAVGLVPQEPFLFSRSIAENIDLGRTVDEARVRAAAEVADLLSNVEAFPKKFDTLVGERGVTLSGGQRQRTALARSWARQPQLMVLDDAMSAVDTETEARILGQLKKSLGGRTVMLIGHRINTFKHADEIVVLDAGRIVERGTHEQLIAQNGAYAELERKQRLTEALVANG